MQFQQPQRYVQSVSAGQNHHIRHTAFNHIFPDSSENGQCQYEPFQPAVKLSAYTRNQPRHILYIPNDVRPLADEAYIRLPQIIGDRKRGIEPLIPISKSAWYLGIQSGVYPSPIKLTPNTSVWRSSDIRAVLNGKWKSEASGAA